MTSRNDALGINTIEEEDSEENYEVTKVVKFAQDEAEKFDAQRDKERSRQELLSKIARLTATLTDAQKQIQTEKDKRKKKEKSLLKLAKELKKRNVVKEKDEDRLEEVCREKCVVERLLVKNERILEL
jgi:septal ring factor EnvC (AmiA/AmiB activator)